MAADNETGALRPIRELAELTHEYGAPFQCDAAQTTEKVPPRRPHPERGPAPRRRLPSRRREGARPQGDQGGFQRTPPRRLQLAPTVGVRAH
ncbi:aminotransferase class V-fold PLP-dependent enzyme [Streptomyces sp. NPDC001617]